MVTAVVLLLFGVAAGASSLLGDPEDAAASTPPAGEAPGIPPQLLKAYTAAAKIVAARLPGCKGMRWQILAGIGQIESSSTTGRAISSAGDVTPHVVGPAIGYADTDTGEWDGLTGEDRAVGPMQFLPSTFVAYAIDGNTDGVTDPHNIYDATATAGSYLCGKAATDLTDRSTLRDAIFKYNHSWAYVDDVLAQIDSFDAAAKTGPGGTGPYTGPASGKAKAVIDAAVSYLGTTYAWGGGDAAGPTRGIRDGGVADVHGDYAKVGFDCSGLAIYAYATVGVSLPHSSKVQFTMGTRIPRSAGIAALRPGDLVFFATSPSTGAGVHHVGIYVGDGKMINAPFSGTVVRYDPLDMSEYAGAARLL